MAYRKNDYFVSAGIYKIIPINSHKNQLLGFSILDCPQLNKAISTKEGDTVPGWVKLYRDIQENWVWKDKPFSYGQAWIDLILLVNHEDRKTLFDGALTLIERGSKIISIRELCGRWGWSNTKVCNFLKLLKNDGMIDYFSDKKKTVITVINYSVYQDVDDNKTIQKRQRNDSETTLKHTNKNVKNDKNEKKVIEVDFSDYSFSPELQGKITEWVTYKSERRDSYKPTGLQNLLTQITNQVGIYGEQKIINLISECMAAGYKGIIWDKLSQPSKATTNRRDNFEQRQYNDDFFKNLDNAALKK